MIKAIIFDMDGVISDTQRIHSKLQAELLRDFGIIISPEEITRRFAGRSTIGFFKELFKKYKVAADPEKVVEKNWRMMAKRTKNNVVPVDGAIELIKLLKKQDFHLAVASASIKEYVMLVISELRLKNKFQTIITGDEVKKGKPDPEVFLLAAKRMGVFPSECVVIEDGMSGMIAAKRAGMKCIGLINKKNKKANYPADLLITSLKEISLETIKRI